MPPSPNGPKTEMGFVTLNTGKHKKKTDELAGRWGDQMMTAGIDVRGYSIEDDRILFVCDQRGYKDMNRVREFVLSQPETAEFEWNSKKSTPTAKDAGSPDPVAKFQQMQEEQAAQAKREAKKAKKEREKRRKEKEKQAVKAKAAKLAEKKKAEEGKKKEKQAAEEQAKKQTTEATPAEENKAKTHDEL
jgi:hypothetical protein